MGAQPILAWAELEGERALVRPVRGADAEHAFPLIHGRREVLDWLIWQGPATVTELADHWNHWATPGEVGYRYHLAIVEKASGAICGTIGLRFHETLFHGDIGYWIGSPYWGKGLATDAVGLISSLAFHYIDAQALVAEVFVGNRPSARVLEKNCFVRARGSVIRQDHGGDREQWVFDLSREHYLESDVLEPVDASVLLEPTGR